MLQAVVRKIHTLSILAFTYQGHHERVYNCSSVSPLANKLQIFGNQSINQSTNLLIAPIVIGAAIYE